MKNKIIKIIFMLTYILFVTLAVKVFAKEIYDMQKINVNVIKPISKFEIEYEMPNGEKSIITSNSKYYSSDEFEFDQEANKISLIRGTKIKVKDLSEAGSGNKIVEYDFQIYKPSSSELINSRNVKDLEKEIILDEEGIYSFYLSVMDDYKNIEGFDNWSVNGNHRWLSEDRNRKGIFFYWYFSQLNINVISEDEEIKEPVEEHEETSDEVDEDSHNPEVEFLLPDHFYPNEVTNNSIKYINDVWWFYYDEDNDEIIDGGYELYKVNKKGKELLGSKKGVIKNSQCKLIINGEMHDKFQIDVWVKDEENNVGRNSTIVEIEEFFPNINMNNNDRVYLNDDLEIEFTLLNDFDNLLKLTYEKYQILKEGKVIIKDDGMILTKLKIACEKFEENNTYEFVQYVSNSYGTSKKLTSRVFVVPIEKPLITLDNISLYYGEEKDTNLKIVQMQSKLKSYLKDYEYEFKDEDCHYEIFLNDKKIFFKQGKIDKFFADESMNIKNSNEEQIYTIYQYATNGANKTGVGKCNVVVKTPIDDYIKVEIIERDNNPLTIKDEIYKNESLLISTKYYSKDKINKKYSRIINSKNEIVKEYNELLNGLYPMNFDEGIYKIEAIIETANGTIKDCVSFEIKKIDIPIINVINFKDKYYKTEKLEGLFEVRDINISEEHPNGFELNNSYYINDEKTNGIFKSLNLNYLKNKKEYRIIQKSINKEHENVFNEKEIMFYLDNLEPIIESNNLYEYNTNEKIEFDITASDMDGYIKDFILESDYDFDTIDIKNSNWTKHVEMKINEAKTINIRAVSVDDSGDSVSKIINIKILDNPNYPYIKLLTKEENRRKINRYIQIEYGTSDNTKADLYFENEFVLFNNYMFENEIVKIIKENDNCIGLYFKKYGNYNFKVKVYDQERKLDLMIKNDEEPIMIINSNQECYRNPLTKKAVLNINVNSNSDDEIEYEKIYVDDKEYNSNDMIELDYNEVGFKKIKGEIKETHDYLPNVNHPFYSELIGKMKSSYSNEILVNVLNMKPEIMFSSKTNNYKINIME